MMPDAISFVPGEALSVHGVATDKYTTYPWITSVQTRHDICTVPIPPTIKQNRNNTFTFLPQVATVCHDVFGSTQAWHQTSRVTNVQHKATPLRAHILEEKSFVNSNFLANARLSRNKRCTKNRRTATYQFASTLSNNCCLSLSRHYAWCLGSFAWPWVD